MTTELHALSRGDRPRDALVATLDYLELSTTDLVATGDYYCRVLGYEIEKIGESLIGRGLDRTIVLVPGPARHLALAGYRLPDAEELARLRARIAAAGVPAQHGSTRIFADAVSVVDPDGTCFSFGIGEVYRLSESRFPPARLQHLVMASRQPERIVRFFTKTLGFTISDDVLDEKGEVRTSFLRSSQEHHSFAVFKAAEDRLDHHCYETTDWNAIRDWCDHMAIERVPLKWGPGRHGPGNNLFTFVHDPDGNWIELSAELECVKHDRPVGYWPHEERTLNSWGQALLRS